MDYEYIDGQTPLDEEEKEDLIPTILTRADLDRFEQENIIEARKWVMRKSVLARQDIFTDSFLSVCLRPTGIVGGLPAWGRETFTACNPQHPGARRRFKRLLIPVF